MALSPADTSVLAQAKAANYCGQFIALRPYGRHCGSPPGAVSRLYLAGGFANYLNVDNATAIGLIAGFPSERRRAESLARRVEQIELETAPDLFDLFVKGCMLQPMPGGDALD